MKAEPKSEIRHFTKIPHPQPLSRPTSEGSVGLYPIEAERERNPETNGGAQRSDAPYLPAERMEAAEVLTKQELRERLKISMRCLDTWLARGWVTGIKRGRVRRFIWKDVLAELQKGTH